MSSHTLLYPKREPRSSRTKIRSLQLSLSSGPLKPILWSSLGSPTSFSRSANHYNSLPIVVSFFTYRLWQIIGLEQWRVVEGCGHHEAGHISFRHSLLNTLWCPQFSSVRHPVVWTLLFIQGTAFSIRVIRYHFNISAMPARCLNAKSEGQCCYTLLNCIL